MNEDEIDYQFVVKFKDDNGNYREVNIRRTLINLFDLLVKMDNVKLRVDDIDLLLRDESGETFNPLKDGYLHKINKEEKSE